MHTHRFVPDVHGIQLLTEEHLARAGNLEDWDVQRVDAGRYLVAAKDLWPWFAENEIDLSILAAARQDFHDMLLTPEVIEAHRRASLPIAALHRFDSDRRLRVEPQVRGSTTWGSRVQDPVWLARPPG